jgi:hypothetical protein
LHRPGPFADRPIDGTLSSETTHEAPVKRCVCYAAIGATSKTYLYERSSPVSNQNYKDDARAEQRACPPLLLQRERSYYVAVPADLLDEESSLIDELISLAFDKLSAHHLELRVHEWLPLTGRNKRCARP